MPLLDGKVIVMAGAGGIGAVCAERYAREGASVVVGDINLDHAKEVADGIVNAGGKAVGTRLDGAEEASVAAIVALAKSEFGALHGLHANFFNAGAMQPGGLDAPLESFDETIRVNARGFLLCSRHAVPAIIESGGGTLLYTSSAEAYNGPVERVAYAMSKSAVNALMRAVASKYGRHGVRANAIAPGAILHKAMAARLSDEWKAYAMKQTMLRTRLGRPEDIAAMGALLLSDDGGYVTGQVISVDGGLTARP